MGVFLVLPPLSENFSKILPLKILVIPDAWYSAKGYVVFEGKIKCWTLKGYGIEIIFLYISILKYNLQRMAIILNIKVA